MKTKHKPKYVVLTHYEISIAEFKNKRELNNWLAQYKDTIRPVIKILSGPDIRKKTYLPIFNKGV